MKNQSKPKPMRKYLHCGECWSVLGEISSSEPNRGFDTYDCSWRCENCKRLNLSSDGIEEKYDNNYNVHYIYFRSDKEKSLLDEIPHEFNFNKDSFKPESLG